MSEKDPTPSKEKPEEKIESTESIKKEFDPESDIERLGRTKKRILIELYRHSVGYKRLSKTLGVGLDTIRSHIKSGKYSTSLSQMELVEKGESGWRLTAKGLLVCEKLKEDPELKAFFYE